jgi:uncharacterized protein DUF4412
MKRWQTTVFMLAVCTAVLRADVTIVQSTSMEGGMASMMAQNGGVNMSPKMTTRIKGQKQRSDIEVAGQSFYMIVDLAAKQVAMVQPAQKTVQIMTSAPQAPQGVQMPKMDTNFQPTGRSQTIDGVKCDEYSFSTTIDMSQMGGGPAGAQMPPEAAQMMQGAKMVMKGSIWIAKSVPGAEEYSSFMKAAAKSELAGTMAGALSGGNASMSRMMRAMAGIDGIAYMTEMTMSVEGTGQVADMMRQMGDMHVTNKISSISTDPIDDSVFQIPADYQVIKK